MSKVLFTIPVTQRVKYVGKDPTNSDELTRLVRDVSYQCKFVEVLCFD